jgi:LPXTG-motif cell wall-anchored protein
MKALWALWLPARKAGVAAALGAVAALGAALNDGSVSGSEWLTVVGAALAAGVAVYYTKNKAAE